jgi:uncharacterized membrane protein
MSNLLQSLSKTVHASVIITFTHVIVAIMWVGLLWYLNFVQIPNMPKIPDEQKPAISKVIAPAVLFYFRWAAAITVLSGLILAWLNGYAHQAMTLGIGSGYGKSTAIGIGMWLGIIMAYNAMLFSRTNTLLSLPMLLSMVAAQNLY